MLEIIDSIVSLTKESPVLSGLVGIWGLGVSSYLLRNIPDTLWKIIKKQCTTSVTIINTSKIYFKLLEWLSDQKISNKSRSLKISCGKWGDDSSILSIGYGTHYFLYGLRPIQINLSKTENHGSTMEQDTIELTILGRNHSFFKDLINQLDNKENNKNKLNIFKYLDYWRPIEQYKRNIETVFINYKIKDKILNFVNNFMKNEQWYISKGLSYQTGILLYGAPGTGKSSFVKALVSYLNKDLYVLNVSDLRKIEACLMSLPFNSILLIEDIDGDISTFNRNKNSSNTDVEVQSAATSNSTPPQEPRAKKSEELPLFMLNMTNISDILNSIDGVISNHGRILIATTNHIEKLDAALLRPGRFDLKVEFPFSDEEVVHQFFKAYYPNYNLKENFKVKERISSAYIQNLISCNLDNPDYVLNEITKR